MEPLLYGHFRPANFDIILLLCYRGHPLVEIKLYWHRSVGRELEMLWNLSNRPHISLLFLISTASGRACIVLLAMTTP